MKLILYTTVLVFLVFLLLGIASAEVECPYTGGEATTEYSKCSLVKPAETMVGDEVIINCTNYERVNNRWEHTPMSNTRVSITGYDEFDVALHGEAVNTRKDGTYKFVPRIAGKYLVQVFSGDYTAWFDVFENPEDEIDTGPTAALVAVDNGTDNNTQEEINTTEVNDTVEVTEPDEERGLFDFVGNGTNSEDGREEASSFVLMLVGLMIS